MSWLFPYADVRKLHTTVHRDHVLARVLELGGIDDVRWALGIYGLAEIHRFLRDVGHPELSRRTLRFWRLLLGVGDEPWVEPPVWRRASDAPWVS
jgi:hypothetical protein